ncbi:MAG: hypothetical protein IJD58_03390 [Lachnospiraceae bacterium]|nr:hypothetical protein [Lachnospiraceae bacterium]
MKKIITWCGILTKRQLKRPSLIAVLLCMVVLSITMRVMSKDVTASISVGFVTTDENIEDNLLNHKGLLHFEKYDTRDELLSAVSSSTIQCGYVLKDDFYDSLVNGNNKKLIELIETPENIISLLSNLVMIGTIMDVSACNLLVDDALNQDFFVNVDEDDIIKLREYYEKYSTNDSTFSFDYNALYEDYTGSKSTINIFEYLVTPVRGIVAIFVFIIALTGGLSWFKDKNSNTYANIPLTKRPFLKLLIISIPTIIAMLAGYFSLLVAGICNRYLYELFTMLAYGMLCIIVTYILSSVTNEHIYSGLIPVFILGSIICCPIFFNLANIIPPMKYLQNLFLPTYYFMF